MAGKTQENIILKMPALIIEHVFVS